MTILSRKVSAVLAILSETDDLPIFQYLSTLQRKIK